MNCLSCSEPNKESLVVETEFWHVTLSSNQSYLGRSYVTLKRHCESLSDLEPNEWLDFVELTKKLERVYKKVFDATLFNWSCLMNLAYQESPAHPHVHWHFHPRYNHEVEVGGVKFVDSEFGYHYDKEREQRVDDSVLQEIRVQILQNI